MTKGRCCGCNGPMAVCRACRCAKNKTPCISCYPSRKRMCENQDAGLQHDNSSVNDANNRPTNNTSTHDATMSFPVFDNSTNPSLYQDFCSFKRGSVLERVPKGSRNRAASALSSIINDVCESNSSQDWRKLFRFASLCFRKPKRGGKRQPSLASTINRQIDAFLADPFCDVADGLSDNTNATRRPENNKKNKDIASSLSWWVYPKFFIKNWRATMSRGQFVSCRQTILFSLLRMRPCLFSVQSTPLLTKILACQALQTLTKRRQPFNCRNPKSRKRSKAFQGGRQEVRISCSHNTSKISRRNRVESRDCAFSAPSPFCLIKC